MKSDQIEIICLCLHRFPGADKVDQSEEHLLARYIAFEHMIPPPLRRSCPPDVNVITVHNTMEEESFSMFKEEKHFSFREKDKLLFLRDVFVFMLSEGLSNV